MNASISLSEVLDVAKAFKEEHEEKATKPREIISWDEVKTVYTVYKLGRRSDAYHAMSIYSPFSGVQFNGLDCQAAVFDFDRETKTWQETDGFVPQRNKCVWLQACRYNSGDSVIRTSLIVDYHIHTEGANVPEWLENGKELELAPGDVLLRTMNSFYLLKAKENKRD